jgi:ketopantoate reductase
LSSLIAPAVTPGHTVVVLIQNGLNIEQPLFSAFPNTIILSGVAYTSCREEEPGYILHDRSEVLELGAFHNPNLNSDDEKLAAERFIRIYEAGGKTKCPYDGNVPCTRWKKLMINGSYNPVAAITGLNMGYLRLTESAIDGLVRPAMKEIVTTAQALGHEIPLDSIDRMIAITPIELYVKPSMLNDVESVS